MSLIKFANFISHSGLNLNYKIDCDFLTNEDIEEIAKIVNSEITFGSVYGIPRGGTRLEKALVKYINPNLDSSKLLIVDDVLTTGNSMQEAKDKFTNCEVIGFVIFARGPCPNWIWSLFTTSTSL
jgi:orotate phosphoribosyltransferase